MTEIEQLLATHWNLTVRHVQAVGPVWKVSTDEGEYCLKAGKHGVDDLLFDYHAIEWLFANAFSGTPRMIATGSGEPFAQTDAGPFALQRWVGRPLDVESRSEWLSAARKLAQFHLASTGMELPPNVKRVTFKGKWSKRFEERNTELQQAFQSFHPSHREFEADVLTESQRVLEMASRAMTILQNSEYERLVEEIQATPTLVHGNVKWENFTVDAQGVVHVIDFDSFRLDVSVQDISDLLLGCLPRYGWSLEFAQQLLAAYEEVRPLRPEEVPVMLALMSFPYKPYNVMHKYAAGYRPEEKSWRKWRLAVRDLPEQDEFLMKWASWLQNCVQ
ncbi:MAG: CotS family spore coat protein [Tumebacillaceae bacterium]